MHTNHAEKRVKQRTPFSKKDTASVADKALKSGISQKAFKGAFRKYLDGLGIKYHTTPIVYGNNIYIFDRQVLITVIPLAQKWHKYIKKSKEA